MYQCLSPFTLAGHYLTSIPSPEGGLRQGDSDVIDSPALSICPITCDIVLQTHQSRHFFLFCGLPTIATVSHTAFSKATPFIACHGAVRTFTGSVRFC
jgi:hypothetical protein